MSNDVAYVDNILTYQANKPFIYGCHNFYPQKEQVYLMISLWNVVSVLKEIISIQLLLSVLNQEKLAWSVNDGLPTLEEDRELPIEVQAKKMFATGLIDDVIIGNSYASDEELKT